MSEHKKVDLRKIFESAQEKIKIYLEHIRASYQHNGIKGNHTEQIVRDLMKKYLPQKFDVGTGEIIDTNYNRSQQIDVVVTTEDHPSLLQDVAPNMFFIEGVAMAGEIKTRLTSSHLEAAMKNALSFKKLEVVLQSLLYFGNKEDSPYLLHPPYFLFAFESDLNISGIYEKVTAFQNKHKLDSAQLLDAIFLADKGTMINYQGRGGIGHFGLRNGDNTDMDVIWGHPDTKLPLFDFVFWISTAYPRLIRNRPVLQDYLMNMNSSVRILPYDK
ncbi:MAG: DUF6602 domain-containing protein [Chloroflexota bacterium]